MIFPNFKNPSGPHISLLLYYLHFSAFISISSNQPNPNSATIIPSKKRLPIISTFLHLMDTIRPLGNVQPNQPHLPKKALVTNTTFSWFLLPFLFDSFSTLLQAQSHIDLKCWLPQSHFFPTTYVMVKLKTWEPSWDIETGALETLGLHSPSLPIIHPLPNHVDFSPFHFIILPQWPS